MKIVRKHPPARVLLPCIGRSWQSDRANTNIPMVNEVFTTFVRSRETALHYGARMTPPFIHGREALADATDLIERYGEHAGFEAAARAERSRDEGNVTRFCHWRHIQRVISTLRSDEVNGTVH